MRDRKHEKQEGSGEGVIRMKSTAYKWADRILVGLFVICIVFFAVSIVAIANNIGYKDGYCSALGGATIGDARVCNVDGRVVEIPSP